MSKEKDKFRRLTVENEDRMAALKKLKGDIMKIWTVVGDSIKWIKVANDKTAG